MEDTKSGDDDSEVEEYYIKRPKVYENIESNVTQNNKGNIPKIIPADFKKQNKGDITLSKQEKKALLQAITNNKEKNNNEKEKHDKDVDKKAKIVKIEENETKEEKALRKKLSKEEKKQKRVQKKQLKDAYTVNMLFKKF